jgi:hypothetical protein
MRSRALFVVALLSVPAVSIAQAGVRLPRGTGATPGTRPANLPPEIPAVARALEFRRSRWSGEGYSMFSAIQVPAASGSTSYTAVGAGTRADYRFAEHFSATLDVTASFLGSFANSQTGEFGTRYVPNPRGQTIRPYFDIRAAYTHVNNQYSLPNEDGQGPVAVPPQQFAQERGRYTGGMGAVGGMGFEYSVTNSLAFTNEITAMRTHMNSHVLSISANNPSSTYWMMSYRYTLGLKYNPVQALHLVQRAMQ